MRHSSETSPAFDRETTQQLLDASRFAAYEEAGKKEVEVSNVKDLHRAELQRLLYGQAKGADGASVSSGEMKLPDALEAELTAEDEERRDALGDAKNVHIFTRKDEVAAVQNDGDRSIGIAHDGLSDSDDLARRAAHEYAHVQQEAGNAVAEVPHTGNSVIDGEDGTIDRLTFREDQAMKAEKKKGRPGASNHTDEYRRFSERSRVTAAYLNDAGLNGDQLVESAGSTNEGFHRLTDALVIASTRNRLKESGVTALAA